jgi:hypothetical protein
VEEGDVVAAVALRLGFRRKKKGRRLIGQAHLAVTEGGQAAVGPAWPPWAERREVGWVAVAHEVGEWSGPDGGGREVGHGGAKRWAELNSRGKEENQFELIFEFQKDSEKGIRRFWWQN